MHAECLKIENEHVVLVCVERILSDGFVIKINDLQLVISEELYLVKKANGKLTRITPSDQTSILFKEEFRSLVFDLAFA